VRPPDVLLPNEPMLCSNGHPIPTNQWAWPHGGVRCRYRIPPGDAGICGSIVYWISFPGGGRVVVEVTSAQLIAMEAAHMDIHQARAYLGLKWPRAA
jgi:hypothetical protein